MSPNRKRTIILCVVLLIGGGWITIAARSTDQKAEPAVPQQSGSLLNDPNFAGLGNAPLGGTRLFTQMMLCILLVAALGAGMVYVSRKVLPKVTSASGKEIRIRETAYLGPRKALHLVEIGNHKLLIGSTNDSITSLADVSDTWLDVPKQESDEAVRL